MSDPSPATAPLSEKPRLSRFDRALRLIGGAFDPRAWAHGVRLINYYNYSHVQPRRDVTMGPDVRISPNAVFAHGTRIIIGARCSIGARAMIWAGPGHGRITLGNDCLIAPGVMMTAANYRFNDGAPINDQTMDEADITIGNDVWLGYGVVVLPGTQIGDGAVIGAGAVVRGKIPARAVVTAGQSMAQQIGQRTLPGDAPAQPASDAAPASDIQARVREILAAELSPDVAARLDSPLGQSGLDSFDLISLRTAVEAGVGHQISDSDWSGISRLSDIPLLPSLAPASGTPAKSMAQSVLQSPAPAPQAAPLPIGRARRSYTINMPQMALSGLSEPWIFKELGDLHWQLITEFLKTPSRGIVDAEGDRLYATFTRILLDLPDTLRSVRENNPLDIDARLERYGSSFFFGHHDLVSTNGRGRAVTMSTFAKYGERGENTSLIKGTPLMPDPEALPPLADFPELGKTYRARRAENPETTLFECEYKILPPHDINGVGLLYFAAYPTIFDLCFERSEGDGFLLGTSTLSKDICYFANSEPDETLIFKLHSRNETDDAIEHHASLYRSSDHKRMAEVVSRKRKAGEMPRG